MWTDLFDLPKNPLLSFLLICSLSLASSYETENSTSKEPFELDEFLYGTFQNKGWNGTWVSGDLFLVKNRNQDIYRVNATSRVSELFLEASIFENYPGSTFSVTHDLKYALLRYNQKAIFRHSTTAQFTIYDIESKIYYHIANQTHLQYAKWAPAGSELVYILENNIYFIKTPKDAENPIQITHDGIPGLVYNGVPDWVYEEEVLGAGSAVWFSPNGKRLAFATFNDTKVNEFHYFMYGEPGKLESQYPQLITLKYPKVGARNPTVSVKYVDLENPTKVETLSNIIPENDVSKDHILQDITWANDESIVAVSLNRVQTVGAITRCNVVTLACNEKYVFNQTRGWLTLKSPIYNKNGTKFILGASLMESNDSYRHLVLYDSASSTRERLTLGKRVITAVYGWDEARNLIYYSSTVEDHPSNQHIFVMDIGTKEEVCLTCNLVTPSGLCKVANAVFSTDFSYYAKICSGPGPNIIYVQSTQSLDFFVWEDNKVLRNKLEGKLLPIKKDLKVPIEGGFVARVRLLLPPDLDECNETTKYPMIVNVYAGPNSNRISDSFSTGIENYFVTNRKYIYAYIDGRGSGRNGDNLMFSIYRKLGTLEIEDQITVTKYLQDTLPYIDSTKTGIWGWSYGGFSTIWALIKDTKNVFKLGLAIAPVTNFIYYDSIYTERYMGLPTPDDNLIGYANTDTTTHVEALRNKTLFLIHGNADDNVHYQQSMILAKALERADILFRQQSYPDENHGLSRVSPHLYHNIDQFFNYGFHARNPHKWKLRKTKSSSKILL